MSYRILVEVIMATARRIRIHSEKLFDAAKAMVKIQSAHRYIAEKRQALVKPAILMRNKEAPSVHLE
jgi:hypothetical protein